VAFCAYCGAEADLSSEFCRICGSSLADLNQSLDTSTLKGKTSGQPISPSQQVTQKVARPKAVFRPPGTRFCYSCQQYVKPKTQWSVCLFIFLLFFGILPGILYATLGTTKICPMCRAGTAPKNYIPNQPAS
jgi:hypothetical protein